MKKLFLSTITITFCYGLFSQEIKEHKGIPIEGVTKVITATKFSITQPISVKIDEITGKEKRKESKDREKRKPQTFMFSSDDGAIYGEDPSVRQTTMGTKESNGLLTNWAGLSTNSDPLDPSGAAGLTKYVQSINSTPFRVFDKSSGSVLFTGQVGTITETGTDGDPIVLYDKFADRWLIAQLGTGNSDFAIAISKTNNPAGEYYAYYYNASEFPDYLKFSIWENGYYMTSNGTQFIYCFERDQMLAGNPNARAIVRTFTIPNNAGYGFWLPLPADADGLIPPSGSRCPMFSYTDNGWGVSNIDAIKVWSMGVTWGTTPTADITLDQTIPTASFDASYDNVYPAWEDITQPNTTQKLDGLGGVCMYRSQWRKWTTYNSVVLNWAVKIDNVTRSIRWCEIRQDQATGTWSLYQEGTYAPDAHSRWNGSIAMDENGSIGLCYAKSSSTVSPSLAFTGRIASDPLGTMSLTETVVSVGSGSITSSNRFGDYSHTSIDPSDQLTFWHTGMYCLNNNGATRIYSFKIPTIAGINENENKLIFNAYQEGNIIKVYAKNLPYNEEYVIDLFDINGKQLSGNKLNSSSNSINTAIDINGLSKGTFLVRIGNIKFQRVVKVLVK